jgi:glycosyltransferase involved in cell wall biosynthesis
MSSDKFLSIVTISLNQRDYLREAIKSVLSQKGADVQYIVVDPGSTDGSREVIAEYRDAIDHIVLEPDRGPADGLNKGFALARGHYGYFINSDDFLLPGAINRLRALWQQHVDVDVLLCGAWMVDGAGRPLKELRPTPLSLSALLEGRAAIVQQGMSIRMELFRAAGGFNPANRTCWDFELVCALLQLGGRTVIDNERIGAFRLHTASLTGGVGGLALERKYRADLDRIATAISGMPPNGAFRLRQLVARPTKLLMRPRATISQLLDSVFPRRRDQRFRNDLGKL